MRSTYNKDEEGNTSETNNTKNSNKVSNKDTVRINSNIKASSVRLITEGGAGEVMTLQQALAKAAEQGLDLVEVSYNQETTVCKIMDYGKYRFDQQKRKKDANKKQKQAGKKHKLKELYIHLAIAEHDYQVRLRQLINFIEHGMRVKIAVKLRGREMAYAKKALSLLERFHTDIGPDNVKLDVSPKMEGDNAVIIFAPVLLK